MPETSLFDVPQGPPAEAEVEVETEAPRKPARGTRRARKAKFTVDRDSDTDLDAVLTNNTPQVIDPGYDGHMLRVAGTPWAEIAKRIGSPSPMAAVHVVSRYLTEAAKMQSAEHMQEALQTQVDRYETVLRHWWPMATEGLDEKAALVVLRTLERLDRVQRLTDSEVSISRETIVVSGDPESYVKQLQQVVADRTNKHTVDAVEPIE